LSGVGAGRGMHTKHRLWILLLALLLFGGYPMQRMGSSLRGLEAQGFRVDLRIEHHPLLVFDRQRQQGARVFADRVERFTATDLLALEWLPLARSSQEPAPQLQQRIRGVSLALIRLSASAEQLRQWQHWLEAWQQGG